LIVVLIVVSIPEGLPLTIGVSLAFTVMRMYSENILVRKLDAPEKMGSVEEILVSKTSTITKSEMKVAQFYCESRFIRCTRPDTLINCELSEDAITRIKECILYNCDARIEMDTTTYIPVGNGTEVGLLKFL
jgi:Ca2+-transporting ATPase